MALFRNLGTAALLLTMPAVAAAAVPQCLQPQEARAIVRLALPDVAAQLSDGCAATLPASAYLIRSRAAFVARMSEDLPRHEAFASAALAKVFGLEAKQAARIDSAAMHALLRVGIGSAIAGKLNADACATANDVVEQMAPLPADNVAALLAIALQKGSDKSDSPFKLCGAAGR